MRVLTIDAYDPLAAALACHSDVELMALSQRRGIRGLVPRKADFLAFDYPAGHKLSWQSAKSLRQAITQFQPDLIQAFLSRSIAHTIVATTGLVNRPKIVAFRGITKSLTLADPGNWVTFLNPKVDAFSCESDAIRQSLVGSGIKADRCWVTYNGVIPLGDGSPPRKSLLQRIEVPSNAFLVGTVASMRPIKGIDLLLKAAIDCHDLHDTYWVLIGKVIDPRIRKLAQDARIRDRVRLMGHLPEARELIAAANLFVMPSRSEGLCRALLEAMEVGVCPIVSDAGGMKEVVRHRRDGLVFARESVDELSKAIRLLHTDRELAKAYGISARQRIADSFSVKQMAERLVEGYREVFGFRRNNSLAA